MTFHQASSVYAAFDSKAGESLNQSFDDAIVFRVDFSREMLTAPWPPRPGDVGAPEVSSFALISKEGGRIQAVQTISEPNENA